MCGVLGVVISPLSMVGAGIVFGTDWGGVMGRSMDRAEAKKTLGVHDVSSSSSWTGSREVAECLRCGLGVGVTIGSMPGPWPTGVVTTKGGQLGGVGAKLS